MSCRVVVSQWSVGLNSTGQVVLTWEQIYEDAEAKYAKLAKSINSVIEEARAVLYAGSKLLSSDVVQKGQGSLFAVNNTPNCPRQEVIAVPCSAHASLRSSSAQISADGETGYVLVESGKKGNGNIANVKGLFADIARVSGTHRDTFMGYD